MKIVKDIVLGSLKYWSLVLGVSIYGIDKRRPKIDGTAIVHLVSPMQTLQTRDRRYARATTNRKDSGGSSVYATVILGSTLGFLASLLNHPTLHVFKVLSLSSCKLEITTRRSSRP